LVSRLVKGLYDQFNCDSSKDDWCAKALGILIIMVLFMTPFVKPLTWRQIVFTYLIPIIPICHAWDGQASLPRMFTLKDLDHLLEELGSGNYTWQKGHAIKKNGKKQGTYLLGLPN
jgi:hypothetical protein